MFAYKILSIGVAAPSSLSMAIFEVSTTRVVVVAGDLSWRETAGLELTVHGRRFIRWFQPESATGRSINDMAANHCGPWYRLSFEARFPLLFTAFPTFYYYFCVSTFLESRHNFCRYAPPSFLCLFLRKGLKQLLQTTPMDWFRLSDSCDLKARQNIQDTSGSTNRAPCLENHWILEQPPGENSERRRTLPLPSTRDKSIHRIPVTHLVRFYMANQKGDLDGNKQEHRPISRCLHARQTSAYAQLTIDWCHPGTERPRIYWFEVYEKPIYGKPSIRSPNARCYPKHPQASVASGVVVFEMSLGTAGRRGR